MKKIKVGQVKVKVNAKGKAREKYEVKGWIDHPTKKDKDGYPVGEYKATGEFKERNIYALPYQTKNKLFKHKNNYFDPVAFKAVSYNWWTYVMKIKGKVVFNDHNYSMTTCKHQGEMRTLLRQLGIKIDLYVNMHQSLENFETQALRPLYELMFQLEIETARKGSKPETNKVRKAKIKTLIKNIAMARKLGAKFSPKQVKELQNSMVASEAARVEKMRNENQATREARKAARTAMNSGDVFATQF